MTPIRVLLVDDHAVITDGLSSMLSRYDDLEVVGAASGGELAQTLCTELDPDVILMDLSMPEMDGVTATRNILSEHDDVRIIALTGFLDEQLVSDVLAAGASGYLLKSIGGRDLVEAIRAVAQGRATISLDALPGRAPAKQDDASPAALTPRERDVLDRLTLGETNKQIATTLMLSPGTVRVHVSNILAKLRVQNRTAAAHYAVQHGLVSEPTD